MKYLKLLTLFALVSVFFSNSAFADNPADCIEVRLLHNSSSNRVETFANNRCAQDVDVVFYNDSKVAIGTPFIIGLQQYEQVMSSIYSGNIYYAACYTTDDECKLQKSLDENIYRSRTSPSTQKVGSSNKAANCLNPYLKKGQGTEDYWLYVESKCNDGIAAKFYENDQSISNHINLRGSGDKKLVTDRVPQGEICWLACFHKEKDGGNNQWGMCSFQTFDGEYFTGRKPDNRGDSITACKKLEPAISPEEELANKLMGVWEGGYDWRFEGGSDSTYITLYIDIENSNGNGKFSGEIKGSHPTCNWTESADISVNGDRVDIVSRVTRASCCTECINKTHYNLRLSGNQMSGDVYFEDFVEKKYTNVRLSKQ